MFEKSKLFALQRDGFTEVVVHGEIVVFEGSHVLYQTGDAIGSYPMRSLLKPFQFLATGVLEQNGNEPRYTACLGSISANHEQIAQIEKWYETDELCALVPKLRLPPSFPMDEKHRITLKALEEKPSVLFHTCFSKHMAILEGCQIRGWGLENYNSVDHPYHAQLMKILLELLDEDTKSFGIVSDGCLLPSPVLNLRQMAKLYQSLSVATPGRPLHTIQQMMLEKPEWIGANGRADTKLMQANPGKLIAKEGADGLMGVAVLPTKEYPMGLGIVLKLLAGYHPNLALMALGPVLEKLRLKEVHEIPVGQEIKYYFSPFNATKNSLIDISPLLCEEIAVWPGDEKYKRSASMQTLKGQHLTLSSISTTLHVGAHTDGPNHFENSTKGIETNELEPYAGACQVIEITKDRGALIERKDLEKRTINAKRVLIQTNSFPDPNHFNEDFVAFSACAIEYLGELGVVLLGVDTPSIDAMQSKTLPAHHATSKTGIRILEGIVLKGVEEGLYELSALPLKIKDGDASPVRAVLSL